MLKRVIVGVAFAACMALSGLAVEATTTEQPPPLSVQLDELPHVLSVDYADGTTEYIGIYPNFRECASEVMRRLFDEDVKAQHTQDKNYLCKPHKLE